MGLATSCAGKKLVCHNTPLEMQHGAGKGGTENEQSCGKKMVFARIFGGFEERFKTEILTPEFSFIFRVAMVDGQGDLEDQLAEVKKKSAEIADRKEDLRILEDLGAQMEEALILDNK